MKKLYILCIALVYSLAGYSQTITAKNALYVELLGNSYFYSVINYDRIVFQRNSFALSTRIGVSAFPYAGTDKLVRLYPSFPLEINAFVGKNKHHFEYGIGATIFEDEMLDFTDGIPFEGTRSWYYSLAARLGYRHQKPEGGLFYRIAFTPLVYPGNRNSHDFYMVLGKFRLWGGFSIGKSF